MLKFGVKFSFLDISRYKDHVKKHPVTLITLGNKNKIYKLPCSTQNTRHVSRVKSHIHHLFETKILYEPNFHFVKLNLFCFLSMFFGTQHFSGPQNKSKKLKIKKIEYKN